MERLGCSIDDAARRYGWGALRLWASHLPVDSAVYRSRDADMAAWALGGQQTTLLADLYDAVMASNWIQASRASGKKQRKPEPYPRPWARRERQHFGAGAIPISEFESWYYGEVD